MKAIICTKYGGPEVLQLREVEKPTPKDDEVLVKVHAVSVNDWDWGIITGLPKLFRLFSGFRQPKTQILGSDIAGVTEAVGKDVKQFKPGDEVYGDLSGKWGGFAEYVCTKEKFIAKKPAGMSFIDAAAIPQAGMLAYQGLIDAGKIQPGQKILINGAGGGVGTLGVQIAKLYNVEVTGVDSGEKLDMMRSLGFDHVIDYKKEDFARSGLKYDLILDTKTNRSALRYTRALTPHGAYVTVGGSLSRIFGLVLLRPWIKLFRKKKVQLVMLKQNKDLTYMNEIYEAGKLKPVIDGPYKLEETAHAFAIFEKAQHKGKMVIII